jgi:lipopolysaccharide/colanic/teichoic acid biosynthesis glycosyltransferase
VYSAIGKRSLDLACALVLGILLIPVLLLIALLVRIDLGSPVLFRQERPGRDGKIFVLKKFRTMKMSVDIDGKSLPDSERMTRFGDWLRSTSMDELPELWNVIRGEMSLIGPRPLLPEYLRLYSPYQARRHEVRPGLTGLAQVSGRNALSWPERFNLDVWYVENLSIGLDAYVLKRTIRAVFRREGVSADGDASMSPFTGA